MNKRRYLFIVISLIILLGAAGFLYYHRQNPSQPIMPGDSTTPSAKQRFQQAYPKVADNHPFVQKTISEIIDQLQTGTGVIYLGFPECPWCQKYIELVDQVARQHHIKQISYYDIRQIRSDNTPDYQKIVALLKTHGLDTDQNGQPRIFVPELVIVKNGQILSRDNTSALNSTSKDGPPEQWWTEQRILDFKTKLTTMLTPLTTCSDNCNS